MPKRLEGKVAIVTGAGRGIGRAEAITLASEGARVLVNDLGGASDGSGASRTPAEEVVLEIRKFGGEAAPNYDSVATPEGGESIVRSALDRFGRIDIVVNNAGILRDRMIFNMTEEEWDSVIKVHLYGTFHVTRCACAQFRQQKSGRIINTSSLAGLGYVGQANYSAAKEGIVGLTRTVAIDMGKYGVTCNAIRPIAGTRMALQSEPAAGATKRDGQAAAPAAIGLNTPEMQSSSTPEMIAPLVVWLASDAAAGVNGHVFFVGGGTIGLYKEPEIAASVSEPGKIWTVDELTRVMPKKILPGLDAATS